MRATFLVSGLCCLFGLGSGRAARATPSCKETCQAERERLQKRLDECLAQVDPYPPDRAAKMRLLCRQRYSPPRCDELPPCGKQEAAPKQAPGMRLGPMMFSAQKRGPALTRPSYAPGEEVFVRTDVEILPKPTVSRIWLRMDLRLVAVGAGNKGGARVIARWDSYAEEQRLLDPAERGLPLRFTMHGGARLPADVDPGGYRLEADVVEQVSKFKQTTGGGFEVRRGRPVR